MANLGCEGVGSEQQWIAGDDAEIVVSAKSLITVGSYVLSRKLASVSGSVHHGYTLLLLESVYKLYESSKSGKAQGKLILKIADV